MVFFTTAPIAMGLLKWDTHGNTRAIDASHPPGREVFI